MTGLLPMASSRAQVMSRSAYSLAEAWLPLLRVRHAWVAGHDAARRVTLGCSGRCSANVAPASPFNPLIAPNPQACSIARRAWANDPGHNGDGTPPCLALPR